ncbi:hypothetical protein [Thiocystis violacea]|uniref:COG3904 family protein n=1 Tax=Thiocystis violacea TaxID=13725 RepID=UPI001906833B|nr:hypothetical protein [Thiocystis violacea]MBK1718297.1 hypothetical protein [Thiocystis violacea]
MPTPVATLAALPLLLLALAGCASVDRGGESTGAVGSASLGPGELLSTVASCHLLRVGQTNDVAVTDATVIIAADKYGLAITTIVERANQMVREYERRPSDLVVRAVDACQRLADLTGIAPALVRFESDGRLRTAWLRIDNVEIVPGFAQRTIADLRRRKAIGLVINSPGGSVDEARKLGRYLRANGLRSAVDGYCASACVDVLAGGVERYVTSGAKLGIHQSKVPRRYSSHEGGQLYVADAFLYLREMGVDADVAIAAAAVPNNQVLLISLSDALATKLVTGVVDGFE